MQVPSKRSFAWIWACSLIVILGACSHKKLKDTPELSELEGKHVALMEIQGEATARKVVEVALINQLVKRGTFNIVSKEDLEKAKSAPDQDPTDWKGAAQRAGADYALFARVLTFEAPVSEGVSETEVYDSELAAERGEDQGKTKRLYRVKAMRGKVQVDLQFHNLATGDLKSAVAEAQEEVQAEAKDGAAHLPPRLRFLEKLSNQAFEGFFETYSK